MTRVAARLRTSTDMRSIIGRACDRAASSDEPIDQPFDQPVEQAIDQAIDQPVDGPTRDHRAAGPHLR